jgi:hypothetical protein
MQTQAHAAQAQAQAQAEGQPPLLMGWSVPVFEELHSSVQLLQSAAAQINPTAAKSKPKPKAKARHDPMNWYAHTPLRFLPSHSANANEMC